ncbi:Astra associated protein 1 Asa1 [Sorochytrium milnesiophthora]
MTPPEPPPPIYVFREHTAPITSVSFSDDARLMISGDGDGQVIIWDMRSRRPYCKWSAHEQDVLVALFLQADPSPTVVLTHGRDNVLKIWELGANSEHPAERAVMATLASGYCKASLCQTADGWLVAVAAATENHLARLRMYLQHLSFRSDVHQADIFTLSPAWRFRLRNGKVGSPDGAALGMVMTTALYVKGAPFLLVGYEAGTVTLWSLKNEQTPEQLWSLPSLFTDAAQASTSMPETRMLQLPSVGVSSAAQRQDGRIFVTGGWDAKPLAVLLYHSESIQAVAISPSPPAASSTIVTEEGQLLEDSIDMYHLIAAGSKDYRISLWKLY